MVSSMSHQEVVKLIKCEEKVYLFSVFAAENKPVFVLSLVYFRIFWIRHVFLKLSHSWNLRSSDVRRTAPFDCILALRATPHWPCTQSKNVAGWGGPTLSTSTLAFWTEQHHIPKNHRTQTTTGEWPYMTHLHLLSFKVPVSVYWCTASKWFAVNVNVSGPTSTETRHSDTQENAGAGGGWAKGTSPDTQTDSPSVPRLCSSCPTGDTADYSDVWLLKRQRW